MSKRKVLPQAKILTDAFLCDSVATPPDGKLYAQGAGWTILQFPALPARIPRIGIGLLLRVPYTLADNTSRKFQITLLDADGKVVPLSQGSPAGAPQDQPQISKVEGQFTVGRAPVLVEPGDDQILVVGVNIDGLILGKSGIYKFRITVDDGDAKELRFRVHQLVQPAFVAPTAPPAP